MRPFQVRLAITLSLQANLGGSGTEPLRERHVTLGPGAGDIQLHQWLASTDTVTLLDQQGRHRTAGEGLDILALAGDGHRAIAGESL